MDEQSRPSSLHTMGQQQHRRSWAEPCMDVVARDHHASLKGLAMVYEPRYRRFFQARFQPKAP
ncbi:hypothetical protein ET989_12250 [Propioniciclava sinopodophylli]|jgi:tryptophanase|uniref:Uncharacterized protein n=1 Tax=Propioniciclava sinopodophylli TaxID=1837344 RepID=A0A4Q9KBM3_9ACTN|nr:hypothetical protein [Propioniciclava sinopodophylli]TBT83237.1 hypothetical protein ET989_12250 [Propioniciclava sinopodophylli]